jgi:hypothetical protein
MFMIEYFLAQFEPSGVNESASQARAGCPADADADSLTLLPFVIKWSPFFIDLALL